MSTVLLLFGNSVTIYNTAKIKELNLYICKDLTITLLFTIHTSNTAALCSYPRRVA